MRPHRVDYRGARHHIYNRARHGQPIFDSEADCGLFLHLLSQLPDKFGIRIHGYAIMSNHYHLMLESNGNLSKAMQWLMSVFGRRYNAAHPGYDGTLWRSRFQNRLAETDQDWRHMLAYLHLNPVRSGCVEHPTDAGWTSCRAYMRNAAPDWLTTTDLLDLHGGTDGLEAYTTRARRRQRKRPNSRLARRRRLRRVHRHGWSLSRMANALGRSRSTVHRWLNNSPVERTDAWGRRLTAREVSSVSPHS